MSSHIIYHVSTSRIPRGSIGNPEALCLVAVQSGSNNSYESGGRRSRSWSCYMLDTKGACMRKVIEWAMSCEGGGTFFGNYGASGSSTPERFIRTFRKQLNGTDLPALLDGGYPFKGGRIVPRFVVPGDDSLRFDAFDLNGLTAWWANPLVQKAMAEKVSAWQLCKVEGPSL